MFLENLINEYDKSFLIYNHNLFLLFFLFILFLLFIFSNNFDVNNSNSNLEREKMKIFINKIYIVLSMWIIFSSIIATNIYFIKKDNFEKKFLINQEIVFKEIDKIENEKQKTLYIYCANKTKEENSIDLVNLYYDCIIDNQKTFFASYLEELRAGKKITFYYYSFNKFEEYLKEQGVDFNQLTINYVDDKMLINLNK